MDIHRCFPLLSIPAFLAAAAADTPPPTFARIPEPEAVGRFELKRRLDIYRMSERPPDPGVQVCVHEGDLVLDGALDLDGEMIPCRGLVVTGHLRVSGPILNQNLSGGSFLLVLGDTRAWAILAGGSEIVLSGSVYLDDAALALGVSGELAIGRLDAPVLAYDRQLVEVEAGRFLRADLYYHDDDIRCWSEVLDEAIPLFVEYPEDGDCVERNEVLEDAGQHLVPRMRARLSILRPERRRSAATP